MSSGISGAAQSRAALGPAPSGDSGTLIGDADGLYHPAMFNNRLSLGLKGTSAVSSRSAQTAGLSERSASLWYRSASFRSSSAESALL
jgi:hypothetical protein